MVPIRIWALPASTAAASAAAALRAPFAPRLHAVLRDHECGVQGLAFASVMAPMPTPPPPPSPVDGQPADGPGGGALLAVVPDPLLVSLGRHIVGAVKAARMLRQGADGEEWDGS